MNLTDFISRDELAALIRRAKQEDLGPDGVDVTSALFIPADAVGEAAMVSRQGGHVAGLALLAHVAGAYDRRIDLLLDAADGDRIEAGQSLARFHGPLRSILSMERVALNFVTHLSGIASLTARYVSQAQGTKARICDTRKTLPGLRGLQKYAVVCGGGTSHRTGLYDAMLIKDNHLSTRDAADLTDALRQAVVQARAAYPRLKFIEVEVDTLEQLEQVLPTPPEAPEAPETPDIVLLDNFTLPMLREAVAMRDHVNSKVQLEASGGVNLETVQAIAGTGVDRISVGALTHSAPALDVGLDIPV